MAAHLLSMDPALPTQLEESMARAAQELTSVLNAPQEQSSWLGWMLEPSEWEVKAPPLPPGALPLVSPEDLDPYLARLGPQLTAYEQSREQRHRRRTSASEEEGDGSAPPPSPLPLASVPPLFFREDLDLDDPELWTLLASSGSDAARQRHIEELTGHLDAVEGALAREVGARAEELFRAADVVQELRGSVSRLCERVARVRETSRSLEREMGAGLEGTLGLVRRRGALAQTCKLLRAAGEAQAASAALDEALRGGGDRGAADYFRGSADSVPCADQPSSPRETDYEAVLGLLEALQATLDAPSLQSLRCLEALPPRMAAAAGEAEACMARDLRERCSLACSAGVSETAAAVFAGEAEGVLDREAREVWAEGGVAEAPRTEGEAEKAGTSPAAQVRWIVTEVERSATAMLASFGCRPPPADGSPLDVDALADLLRGLRRVDRARPAVEAALGARAEQLAADCALFLSRCLGDEGEGDLGGANGGFDPDGVLGSNGAFASNGALVPLPPAVSGDAFSRLLQALLLLAAAHLAHLRWAASSLAAAARGAGLDPALVQAAAAAAERRGGEALARAWAGLLAARAARVREQSSAGLSELDAALRLSEAAAGLGACGGAGGQLAAAERELAQAVLETLHRGAVQKLTALLDAEQWAPAPVAAHFQGLVEALEAGMEEEERGAKPGVSAAPGGASAEPGRASAAPGGASAEPGRASATPGGASAEPGRASATPGLVSSPPAPLPPPSAPPSARRSASPPRASLRPLRRNYTITPDQPEDASALPALARLTIGGEAFSCVNSQLVLLSTLSEYAALSALCPPLAGDVAQRALELCKVFNSRSCQLVLGAGAMAAAGLRSITARHLGVCAQVLEGTLRLLPALRRALALEVPARRRKALEADFGRAQRDYAVHLDEISSKLVSIMRERLGAALKALPGLSADWGSGSGADSAPRVIPSSPFAATLVKQLGVLRDALSPLVSARQLEQVFEGIVRAFAAALAEAFNLLEPGPGGGWEEQFEADAEELLRCLRLLPMPEPRREAALDPLDSFCRWRFERRRRAREASARQQAGGAAGSTGDKTGAPPFVDDEAPGCRGGDEGASRADDAAAFRETALPASPDPPPEPSSPPVEPHSRSGSGADFEALVSSPEPASSPAQLPRSSSTPRSVQAVALSVGKLT